MSWAKEWTSWVEKFQAVHRSGAGHNICDYVSVLTAVLMLTQCHRNKLNAQERNHPRKNDQEMNHPKNEMSKIYFVAGNKMSREQKVQSPYCRKWIYRMTCWPPDEVQCRWEVVWQCFNWIMELLLARTFAPGIKNVMELWIQKCNLHK